MLRKLFTSSLLSLVIVGGFFVNIKPDATHMVSFVSETYAAPQCGGANQPKCTTDQEMLIMYNKLVAAINIFLDILTFIVSPAIMLAGWLMSPDWTSGDLFNLRPVLHNLWVLVSNITYFIYALLLIFIALATIFNSQNYGYKKLLPRLALGIILVPLTWWFVQFIISLSTIVTASVMNLPTEVMDKYMNANSAPDAWWNVESIPSTFELFTDPAVIQNGAQKQYTQGPYRSPKSILTSSSGIYGSLLIYGNSIFKLNESKRLDTATDVLASIAGLVNKGILAIVMFVVFGFLVIALVFMLMMRAIKLWFYAIFSPLLTLRYVVGDGLFGGKENSDSFEIKEFIGLAFVPALVGLALSFGIVVVAVLQSPTAGNKAITCTDAMMQADAAGCKIMNIMGSPDNYILRKVIKMQEGEEVSTSEVVMGGITFRFYGSAISTPIKGAAVAQYQSALSAAGNVFGTLIIDMISLIFIWAAFMAAKNVSKVAKAAFAPFEAIGTKVGKMAMDIPKYTPIPGTDGMSISGASKLADNASRAFETAHEDEFKYSKWGKMFGGDRFISKSVEDRMVRSIKDGERGPFQDDVRATANIAEGHRGAQVPAFRDQLNSMDKNKRNEWLETKMKVTDDATRKQILDFMDSSKSKLSVDSDRKELWGLIQSAMGVSGGKTGANGTTGYTGSGLGTNTISLNFNGANVISERGATMEETQKKIIGGMTARLEEMKKKDVKIDEKTLAKMLEGAGIPSEHVGTMSKSILEESKFKDIVKTTTSGTPPPAAPGAPGIQPPKTE
ncbi:hypothetical protein KBC86_00410 [Candidatus Gracilibacteria bacterium]|nr:hypothetical protein [Candidatus Gracilibacteria bacterium]